ncbi:Putative uncharacterized protein [Taphrina deformans PYCC 5710]|uniref:Ras GEF n=1 Tax=Taphrina deformans (strain PYCC 5710 / ATCC 11124 / CBS 356.35 / IMI 108563 / JCM 9778 / NBRC 8474) TaxID=1097556 RepID=R4XEC3_TAPDE|nr:Putative uncharacterized protein [Taphrina deformans PYCC 5710]|eukprot:CCG82821.1 Putative uncharacterized protein [Taphrina deformans PYCC 5710]
MELDELLSGFLDQIDYDSMSDFFLAYRPYLTAIELFDKLSNIYLQTEGSCMSLASHYTRVRTFVAIRHWILNYFPDDFLLSVQLQQNVEQFLHCLGGVGADEITTEARIAKELRRSWERQRDLHTRPDVKLCDASLHKSFLRERHISIALPTNDTETLGTQTSVVSMTAITQIPNKQNDGSTTCGTASACHHDDAVELSTTNEKCEAVHEIESTETAPSSPRRLRRRPGGILKNANTVAEVVANNRLSMMSANSTPRNFKRLNGGFSLRRNTRSTLSLQKQFTQDLAKFFESDHCDESLEDPAAILSRTMDKLEGRIDELDEDNVLNSHTESMLQVSLTRGRPASMVDDSFITGTRKRKRHAGRVGLADVPSSLDCRETVASKRGSNQTHDYQLNERKRVLSIEGQSSDEEVSLIDALGIAPLPGSMLEATAWATDITRPQYSSWILQYNTAHLSNCLLAIEQAAFCELDWLELTSGAWDDHLTDHVQDWHEVMDMEWHSIALILARSNLTTLWITSEIVQTTDTTDRASVVIKLIDIAQLCHDHNNFASVVQIVSALQGPAINRLRDTWTSLGPDALKTWTRLSTVCDARSRYSMLRSVQDRVLLNPDASLVPCLAPYLDSIRVAHSSTGTITEKMTSMAKTTKVLMDMSDRIVVNDEDLNHSLLDQLVWIRGVSEEQAMALSKVCEA